MFAPPPSGSFDTRLTWQGLEYFTDIRDTSITLKIFPMSYHPTAGEEISLYWNSVSISALGIFTIVDDPLNPQFTLDMSTIDSLAVSTSSYISDSLKIIFNPGGLVSVKHSIDLKPHHFALYQNYPNPFNPNTTIKFDLPTSASVKLKIFDSHGKLVKMVVNDHLNAGRHQYDWRPEDLANGLYFCSIRTSSYNHIMKIDDLYEVKMM